MPQYVQAFGHTVEFPDGMSEEEMAAALKRHALTIPRSSPLGSDSENFWAGTGKSVNDAWNGIRQIGTKVGIGDARQVQGDIDEAKRLDSALMGTKAGMLGNISGNVAMTLLPAGAVAKGAQLVNATRIANGARALIAPKTYLQAAGAGGALGAMQPVATDDSRLVNTTLGAAGGLGGQALVNGLGRIAQPVMNALDPIRQKAVDVLRNAGVPLDLAQVTGSPVWGRIRSALGDNMFTLGGQEAKTAQQKQAFSRAALNLIGEDATAATPDVMGRAERRINDVFGDVLGRNDVRADPAWVSPLIDAHSGAIENEKGPVVNIINRILNSVDPQTGTIPGQVAYNIKKDLDRMASSADSTQNYLARKARTALMDGINSSLSGADQEAFSQARGQFSNMRRLEGAIATDGTGDISPAKLANVMGQKSNRPTSVYGRGPQDMAELAQSGKQVLGDKTPNSGTAARAWTAALLPGMIGGGAAGVKEYMDSGDPTKALEYGASVGGGLFAIPKLAQSLLNNPTAVQWFSQGIRPSAKPGGLLGDAYNAAAPAVRGLLEAPQNSLLAGQTVRAMPSLAARAWLLPPGATYEQYMDAYDKAPDADTRRKLGAEYAASLPAAQQ